MNLETFTDFPQVSLMLEVVKRKVNKDHKQRWVYRGGANYAAISETPIPQHDKISVRWCPMSECVDYNFSPRAEVGLGHVANVGM